MRIAILDLGSNSFHIVVYELTHSSEWQIIGRKALLNTLGAKLDEENNFSCEVIEKSIDAISHLSVFAKKRKAQTIVAFATSVFRTAENATFFVDEIFRKTGIVVDVLSEKSEAELIYKAVASYASVSARALVIDIGGGSSECIIGKEKRMQHFQSIACGCARFSYCLAEAPVGERDKLQKKMRSQFQPLVRSFKKYAFTSCFGTSGFLRCLALDMKDEECFSDEQLSEVTLSRKDIQKGTERLRSFRHRIQTHRKEAVVYAGCYILSFILEKLAIDSIRVLALSTREGYLLKCREERGI